MSKSLFENSQLQNVSASKINSVKNPTIKSGYCLLFDHKAPTSMQYIDYERNIKPLGSGQIINFKIYTMGQKPNITKVKIQIDSDSDPFFSGVYETDQNLFDMLRDDQKLNFDFQQFPTVLIKSLNKIEESKGKVNATLLVYSDGKCKLTIWHSSEYKNIEVISLDFSQQNQENLETKVASKYEELRKKVLRTQQRLAKINQIIKEKNPSLLLQLTKITQATFTVSHNM